MTAVIEVTDAGLRYPGRTLWTGLDLSVAAGEFITVLGSNGTGKSSLLRAMLGLTRLTSGRIEICGQPTRRGSRDIGYIPQHRGYGAEVPLRGRDLVRLGIDGTRWGVPVRGRPARQRVAELIERVGATAYADRRLSDLSGGEQQRLRIAQALATDPAVLLCDEPLLSLDLRHQRQVVDLLDRQRRERGTAVIFVTHEINPVLPVTDRVLYLHDGQFRIGPPEAVMTSEILSDLYQAPIEVLRRGDQLIVLGTDDAGHTHPHQEEPR